MPPQKRSPGAPTGQLFALGKGGHKKARTGSGAAASRRHSSGASGGSGERSAHAFSSSSLTQRSDFSSSAWVKNALSKPLKEQETEILKLLETLRASKGHPDPSASGALVCLAQRQSQPFRSPAVVALLLRILAGNYLFAQSGGLAVVGSTLCYHAFREVQAWPVELVQAFLGDALHGRRWCDHEHAKPLVAGILTGIRRVQSNAQSAQQRTKQRHQSSKQQVSDSSTNSNSKSDGDVGRPAGPRRRYESPELRAALKQMVRETVLRAIHSLKSNEQSLSLLMRVLALTSHFAVSRFVSSMWLQTWLNEPAASKDAQKLLDAVCSNCVPESATAAAVSKAGKPINGVQEQDFPLATVANILRIQLRGGMTPGHRESLVRLLRAHPKHWSLAMEHLCKPPQPLSEQHHYYRQQQQQQRQEFQLSTLPLLECTLLACPQPKDGGGAAGELARFMHGKLHQRECLGRLLFIVRRACASPRDFRFDFLALIAGLLHPKPPAHSALLRKTSREHLLATARHFALLAGWVVVCSGQAVTQVQDKTAPFLSPEHAGYNPSAAAAAGSKVTQVTSAWRSKVANAHRLGVTWLHEWVVPALGRAAKGTDTDGTSEDAGGKGGDLEKLLVKLLGLHTSATVVCEDYAPFLSEWPMDDKITQRLSEMAMGSFPLSEDTLTRVLVLGLTSPLLPRVRALGLTERVVCRALPLCSVQTEQALLVRDPKLLQAVLQLSTYQPSRRRPGAPPSAAISAAAASSSSSAAALPADLPVGPPLCVRDLFWRACGVVLLLCAQNPESLGTRGWGVPPIRALMTAAMSEIWPGDANTEGNSLSTFPPFPTAHTRRLLAAGELDERNRVLAVEAWQLGTRAVVPAQSQLLGRLMLLDPARTLRVPPAASLFALRELSRKYNVGATLRQCKPSASAPTLPDFLRDVLREQRAEEFLPWMMRVSSSDSARAPSDSATDLFSGRLPLEAQAGLVVLALTAVVNGPAALPATLHNPAATARRLAEWLPALLASMREKLAQENPARGSDDALSSTGERARSVEVASVLRRLLTSLSAPRASARQSARQALHLWLCSSPLRQPFGTDCAAVARSEGDDTGAVSCWLGALQTGRGYAAQAAAAAASVSASSDSPSLSLLVTSLLSILRIETEPAALASTMRGLMVASEGDVGQAVASLLTRRPCLARVMMSRTGAHAACMAALCAALSTIGAERPDGAIIAGAMACVSTSTPLEHAELRGLHSRLVDAVCRDAKQRAVSEAAAETMAHSWDAIVRGLGLSSCGAAQLLRVCADCPVGPEANDGDDVVSDVVSALTALAASSEGLGAVQRAFSQDPNTGARALLRVRGSSGVLGLQTHLTKCLQRQQLVDEERALAIPCAVDLSPALLDLGCGGGWNQGQDQEEEECARDMPAWLDAMQVSEEQLKATSVHIKDEGNGNDAPAARRHALQSHGLLLSPPPAATSESTQLALTPACRGSVGRVLPQPEEVGVRKVLVSWALETCAEESETVSPTQALMQRLLQTTGLLGGDMWGWLCSDGVPTACAHLLFERRDSQAKVVAAMHTAPLMHLIDSSARVAVAKWLLSPQALQRARDGTIDTHEAVGLVTHVEAEATAAVEVTAAVSQNAPRMHLAGFLRAGHVKPLLELLFLSLHSPLASSTKHPPFRSLARRLLSLLRGSCVPAAAGWLAAVCMHGLTPFTADLDRKEATWMLRVLYLAWPELVRRVCPEIIRGSWGDESDFCESALDMTFHSALCTPGGAGDGAFMVSSRSNSSSNSSSNWADHAVPLAVARLQQLQHLHPWLCRRQLPVLAALLAAHLRDDVERSQTPGAAQRKTPEPLVAACLALLPQVRARVDDNARDDKRSSRRDPRGRGVPAMFTRVLIQWLRHSADNSTKALRDVLPGPVSGVSRVLLTWLEQEKTLDAQARQAVTRDGHSTASVAHVLSQEVQSLLIVCTAFPGCKDLQRLLVAVLDMCALPSLRHLHSPDEEDGAATGGADMVIDGDAGIKAMAAEDTSATREAGQRWSLTQGQADEWGSEKLRVWLQAAAKSSSQNLHTLQQEKRQQQQQGAGDASPDASAVVRALTRLEALAFQDTTILLGMDRCLCRLLDVGHGVGWAAGGLLLRYLQCWPSRGAANATRFERETAEAAATAQSEQGVDMTEQLETRLRYAPGIAAFANGHAASLLGVLFRVGKPTEATTRAVLASLSRVC